MSDPRLPWNIKVAAVLGAGERGAVQLELKDSREDNRDRWGRNAAATVNIVLPPEEARELARRRLHWAIEAEKLA